MRGHNLYPIGLITIVIGFLLIFFRTTLADGGVVVAAGILFVLAGLLNIFVFLRHRKDGKGPGAMSTTFGWIASAAALVLGLAMLIFSKMFVTIVGFMFGVLILFAALFQLFLLMFGTRPARLSNLYFLVPTVMIGASIYIFMRKPDTQGEVIDLIVVGATFILFGLAAIVEGIDIAGKRRTLAKGTADHAPEEEHERTITDVEAKPVKTLSQNVAEAHKVSTPEHHTDKDAQ